MNLQKSIPEGMIEYMSQEDAHATLVEWYGVDFGYNVERWRQWGMENNKFLDGEDLPAPNLFDDDGRA